MATNGCIKYRAADSQEKRTKVIDQNIYCPTKPDIRDVRAALKGVPYPRLTLGLAPHPTKGAAISSSTSRMPNLTQLLIGFAREQVPGIQFTTISLRRSANGSTPITGAPTHGVRTLIVDDTMTNGEREDPIKMVPLLLYA